jgi:hypothetical protein
MLLNKLMRLRDNLTTMDNGNLSPQFVSALSLLDEIITDAAQPSELISDTAKGVRYE